MSPRTFRGPRAEAVRTVLVAAPNPLVAIDEDQVVFYANDLALEMFGYTLEDLVGQPARVLVAGVAGQAPVPDWLAFVGSDEARRLQMAEDLTLRRRDGSVFPAEVTLTPLETEDGLLVATTVRDITRRRMREERVLDLSRAYESLVELYKAIVRAPDETALYPDICRIAVEHAGYLGAWVAAVGDDGEVERLASAGSLEGFISRLVISLDPSSPHGMAPTAQALREGRAVFSTDYLHDPESWPWRELVEQFEIRGSATLPLRRDGRTVAVLALYTDRADLFDTQMKGLLEAVSENVSLALDRFLAADRLRTLAAQRRELARRLVLAQEDERARIAADVHDESVQSLAAVDLRLGLLGRRVAESAPELAPAVQQVQDMVAEVSAGLRDLLFDLEAADTSTELTHLVREAAAHVFEDSDVDCLLTVDGSGWDGSSTLSPVARGQAVRIVKEALTNVRKHAGATQASVLLVPDARGVEVVISDDGAGFAPGAARSRRGHRGLANMRDRAEVAGGWCRIESGDDGVTVRFWMPYEKTEPDWDGT